MKILSHLTLGTLALGMVGCAATTPETGGEPQLVLTPKARQLIMTQGEATAAQPGYSETTDLVCETRKKLGSHMVEKFCYTRLQGVEARINTQETVRKIQMSDPHAAETRFGPNR